MIKVIGTNPNLSGLGDVLLLTAVCKHFPNLTIQLNPDYEKFVFLFEGICEKIELTLLPVHTKGIGSGTYSKRMCAELGYYGDDTIPFIYTDTEKFEQAKQKIKHIKNPIAVKINCSNKWKHIREYNFEYVKNHIQKLISMGYTPIQFGISDNYTHIDGCIPMIDLNLEDLAALYKAIGLYFGTDTGDFHLMLAVGGKAVVMVPEISHPKYDPDLYVHQCNRVVRHIVPQEYCFKQK
jgi:ADP-heptose:LPS heptosyltransferase